MFHYVLYNIFSIAPLVQGNVSKRINTEIKLNIKNVINNKAIFIIDDKYLFTIYYDFNEHKRIHETNFVSVPLLNVYEDMITNTVKEKIRDSKINNIINNEHK